MDSPDLPEDLRWMQRALELARAGATFASPNPTVGCVLVSNGAVGGEGFHNYEKRDHAEVVALKAAGGQARGATAYVTLEPCSHHGRTPPCADALIAAGVARVVIATRDPNPRVSGNGIVRLRDAGIEVEEDVLCEEARELNRAFAKHITTGLPFVTLKSAVSADGRIAPRLGTLPRGQRARLTSEQADARVQQMRAHSDALLTGIGTVLADDPALTDRSGIERRRPLLRVVLDSRLRLPDDARLLAPSTDKLLVLHGAVPAKKATSMRTRKIEIQQVPLESSRHAPPPAIKLLHGLRRPPEPSHEQLSLKAVLELLSKRGITSVLLEAGTTMNTAMLLAGHVDAIAVFNTPVELGLGGRPPALAPFETLTAIENAGSRTEELGPDTLTTLLLRDPWAAQSALTTHAPVN